MNTIKLTRTKQKARNNYNWIIEQLAHKLCEMSSHNEMESFMMELGCEAMFKGIYEEQEIHDALSIMSDELILM